MPFQQVEAANGDHGAVFVVSHVKMRRIVFVEIHADHNSEKAADLWHGCSSLVVIECCVAVLLDEFVAFGALQVFADHFGYELGKADLWGPA